MESTAHPPLRMSLPALLVLALFGASSPAGRPDHPTHHPTLWYDKPAANWYQALPLGNGRLGAMVYGSVPREQIQLNEESLWAGEPVDVYPDRFAQHLDSLRRMVFQGRIVEARAFGLEKMTARPTSFRSYQPLGDLWIEMTGGEAQKMTDYRRELDLADGMVRIRYHLGPVTYWRKMFISAPDDVLVVRLGASQRGALNARIRLTRARDAKVSAAGNDRLHMDGQIVDDDSPGAYDDNQGGSGPGGAHMKFAGRLKVLLEGGSVRADGSALVIEQADEATLLFTAATDYNLEKMNFDRSIDPTGRAEQLLAAAAARPPAILEHNHRAEHHGLFDRVRLDLVADDRSDLPTDRRLAAVKDGRADEGLVGLYFQFGRYLLMSSSRRPGRLPANLQGLWNDRMWAPWEADYHLNINLQMNYWPADLCNLPQTIDPLADWMVRLADKGRASAKKLYGADGWVAFTSTNPFGRTTPSGSNRSSQLVNGVYDPLAGAWMAMTLWRHYQFTGDRQFLARTAYPLLRGACRFILDYLVTAPDGSLAVVPSTSPENSYIDRRTGQPVRLTCNSTYHLTLVRLVLDAARQAAEHLNADPALRRQVQQVLDRLPPFRIGADGTLQEWFEDYQEKEPGHRHMSHLLAVHPFALITPDDKALFAAARKAVERRLACGGGQTGWSRAWMINFFARFGQGGRAREHVLGLLRRSTHPNLFDSLYGNRLFQIDGNFGATAGIAEMLLQSHRRTTQGAVIIDLLPALPEAWPTGKIAGLCARGGFLVDIDWQDGRLTGAVIRSRCGRPACIRYRDRSTDLPALPGKTFRLDANLQWE